MLRQKPHFSTGIKEKRLLSRNVEKAGVLSERADSREEIVKGWIDKKVVEGVKLEEVFSKDNPLLDKLVIPNHLGKAVVYAHRPGEIEFAHQAFDKSEQQQIKAKERRLNLAVAEAKTSEQRAAAQERLDTFLDALRDKYGDVNVGDNPGIGLPEARMVKSGLEQGKYSIDGLAYAALMWPEVKTRLSVAMAGVDEKALNDALQNIDSRPNLKKLVLEIASSIKGSGKNIGNTLEKLTTAAKAELVTKVVVKPNVTVRKRTRKELIDLREKNLEKYEIGHSSDKAFDLVPPQELANENANLWRLSIDRSDNRVNANNWSIADKNGLARLHFDLKEGLHLNTTAQPWKGVLNQLAKASDETYLKSLAGKADREWFKNPDKFEKELKTVDGGEDFLRAYKYYKALKLNMVEADKREALLTQKDKEKDRIAGVDTVIDGVKKNVAEFTRAVRNKDWATAGVYVAGIYAAYTLFKDSGDSSLGKFMKKALLWGGVGLLGAKVYEASTGQDILKKIGLKDALSDVEKTDLANLFRIPELEGLNKVDTDILHEASKVPMKKLWEQYNKSHNTSNTEGGGNISGFIDPLAVGNSAFEEKFGGLAGGLIDRREDSEYERSGKQLYLIMGLVHQAYMKTAHGDRKSEYYGVDFDDVMKGKEGLGTIDKFLAEMVKYTEVEVNEEGEEEANKRFGEVFAAKKLKPLLRPDEIAGKKVLAGSIMGYPVVVINNGREYAVYDYDEFKKNGAKANKMFTIAREGEVSSSDVDRFAGELEAKAKAAVQKDMPAGASDLKWNGDHWEYKKAGDQVLNNFGITPEEVTVKVVMHGGGRVEHVETIGAVAQLIGQKFVDSKEFRSLGALFDSKDLIVKDVKDNHFVVDVDGQLFEVTFDKATDKFEITKGEKELVQSSAFLDQYLDGVLDDDKTGLAKEIGDINSLVDGANSNFLGYIWERTVTGAKGDPTAKGANLSVVGGSVAKNYTKGLLEATKAQVAARVSTNKFEKFSELQDATLKEMGRVKLSLKKVVRTLSKQGNEEWESRTKYSYEVTQPISEAACVSNEYALAKASFNDRAYQRLSGLGSLTSFDEKTHTQVNEAMKLWFKKTVALDNKDLDVDSPDTQTKKRYLEYVSEEIFVQIDGDKPLDGSRVSEYKEWKEGKALKSVNTSAEKPMNQGELKEYFKSQFKLAYRKMEGMYGSDKLKHIDNDPNKPYVVKELWTNPETTLPGIADSINGEESQLAKWTKEIEGKNLPKWQQEIEVDQKMFEHVYKSVETNTNERFRERDPSLIAASKEAVDAATAWLGEKYEAVKNYVTSNWEETRIDKPTGFDSGEFEFPGLMKKLVKREQTNGKDFYGFEDAKGNTRVMDDLEPLFFKLEDAWRQKFRAEEEKYLKYVEDVKIRAEKNPKILDKDMEWRIERGEEIVKESKNQWKTAEKLHDLLKNKDFDDFYEYAEKHF